MATFRHPSGCLKVLSNEGTIFMLAAAVHQWPDTYGTLAFDTNDAGFFNTLAIPFAGASD